MSTAAGSTATTGLRQLRHDLLNPINVLVGVTNALEQSDLDASQRTWVRILRSSLDRLLDVVDRLNTYPTLSAEDGQARLADLCSIAAARVAKPFDRRRLIETVAAVAGRQAPRVLLVDDSPELAALVQSYVRGTEWDLEIVESGERAVAQATTERYDVVLMDIDLPGLDGATAAHAIRAADLARGVSPTPIVAMTAFDPGPVDDATPAAISTAPAEAGDAIDPEIAPLVPEFLENRRTDIQMFRQALDAREYERIQTAAHKMKGTGRGYGFAEISRIGDELEAAAHAQDTATMARLIDELEAYLRSV